MTPLETKATDAVLAATTAREIPWTRVDNTDVWVAKWREVPLKLTKSPGELQVGRRIVGPGYDPAPVITEIEQAENQFYRAQLRALAGGVE